MSGAYGGPLSFPRRDDVIRLLSRVLGMTAQELGNDTEIPAEMNAQVYAECQVVFGKDLKYVARLTVGNVVDQIAGYLSSPRTHR